MTTPLKSAYSCDFAVTLTLSPHLYTFTTGEQAVKAKRCFDFCTQSRAIHCSAFMEETKDYNIHIHAILKVKLTDYVVRYGARRFIHNLFRNKNWGKVKDIEQVSNYQSWTEYIIKDVYKKDETAKVIDREYYPVLRDDYELLMLPKPKASVAFSIEEQLPVRSDEEGLTPSESENPIYCEI